MEAKNCDQATRLRVRNWFFNSLLEQNPIKLNPVPPTKNPRRIAATGIKRL